MAERLLEPATSNYRLTVRVVERIRFISDTIDDKDTVLPLNCHLYRSSGRTAMESILNSQFVETATKLVKSDNVKHSRL
jgi:hypothetical protein